MTAHSNIVGGSTAKRVIACPGSVKLVQKMPPRPSSQYADEGTLCHTVMEALLTQDNCEPEEFIGLTLGSVSVTPDLLETKVKPALAALDLLDPAKTMVYECEVTVSFGDALPDVFGSADLIGRIGDTAIVLDWKFGDGVDVAVEENPQAMFYAAAAMRTPQAAWAFKGAKEIECVIIQPTAAVPVKRWVTSFERIRAFETQLFTAVKAALGPEPAAMQTGDHCRWCAAKPVCPLLTGAVDRAVRQSVQALDVEQIGAALAQAAMLEGWIADLRALAHTMLQEGVAVPGWKLVPKRATRQWVNPDDAMTALTGLGVAREDLTETKMLSPAQAEKVLKKHKAAMPEGLIVAVSSGDTLAPEDDPRPAALQIGRQLAAALGKIT
jgi:hypothetical protein